MIILLTKQNYFNYFHESRKIFFPHLVSTEVQILLPSSGKKESAIRSF